MYTVFSGVKTFIKCKKLHIDHCVFRLHYKYSVFLLLGFCALVGSKQYAGEPIKCSPDNSNHNKELIEIYCFVSSTYTIKGALTKTPSEGAPYPGIYHSQDEKDFRYLSYYQWIGFLLFFQAMLFYFPHWLWKHFEGGQLSKLLEKDECNSKDPDVQRIKHRSKIVKTLRNRWKKERGYCIKYFFCEFLCLINVIGQMFLLNEVFNDDYLSFGFEVVNYFSHGQHLVPSPFDRIFPRVTSCSFRYFGEGGKVSVSSFLCVLAVNAINEKIFLFIWFWFAFLGILTLIALTYKLIVFSTNSLRFALLRASFRNVNSEHFQPLVRDGNVGDYLLIYLMGQNMEQSLFNDVIIELSSRFNEKFH